MFQPASRAVFVYGFAAAVLAYDDKAKAGIRTPKAEIDLVRERPKRSKEMLR